jgi:hypothetical protein
MEKTQFLMGKSTVSMAIFNNYVRLPEGNHGIGILCGLIIIISIIYHPIIIR